MGWEILTKDNNDGPDSRRYFNTRSYFLRAVCNKNLVQRLPQKLRENQTLSATQKTSLFGGTNF